MPRGDLNEAQSRAVEFGGRDSPAALLIVAGAGSGKTAVLAHRVARLVELGADPQRILLLTFSRRAASDLKARALRVLSAASGRRFDASDSALPWAGTFHSIGARLLRDYAGRIGIAANFTVHDRADSEELMALIRQPFASHETGGKRFPSAATCMAIYSRAVNSECTLENTLGRFYPWCAHWQTQLESLCAAFVEAKQAQQVLDFDDLLLYWAGMMEASELANDVGARFDHVLVDEYQDTNRLQASIVRRMKPDGRGVTVVGDDAQAIYGFRAATVRNILDFPGQFTEPAQIITLEQNYRSTMPILAASNAVISIAKDRYTKNLVSTRPGGERPLLVSVPDELTEAKYVASQILEFREAGVSLKHQAVLFRTSSHSAPLELELTRLDIPFVKFGGLRFLDAAHIKDVLAVLRFIENPRSRVSGLRALRLVPGVGPATAANWLDTLESSADPGTTFATLAVPSRAVAGWHEFHKVVGRLRARDSEWPSEIDLLLEWYAPQLERIHDDAAARLADLEQLRRIAATYPSRERFLTELTLDPPAATSSESAAPHLDNEQLTLSTIHSAKGREWKSVQILKCVDGCIPSDMATGRGEDIEEERRILYVAMTRARDYLALVMPQRFFTHSQSANGDNHVYASPSRFLPRGVRCLFDEVSWPPPADLPEPESTPSGIAIDMAARIRGIWSKPAPS